MSGKNQTSPKAKNPTNPFPAGMPSEKTSSKPATPSRSPGSHHATSPSANNGKPTSPSTHHTRVISEEPIDLGAPTNPASKSPSLLSIASTTHSSEYEQVDERDDPDAVYDPTEKPSAL